MAHLKVQEHHMYPGLGVPSSHREASFGVQAVGTTNLAGEMQFGHLFGATLCKFIGNCVMCLCVYVGMCVYVRDVRGRS